MYFCKLEVVEVREGESGRVDVNYYMLETSSCTAEGGEDDLSEENLVKAFMKAGQLTPIDTYSLAHGEFCKIFGEQYSTDWCAWVHNIFGHPKSFLVQTMVLILE